MFTEQFCCEMSRLKVLHHLSEKTHLCYVGLSKVSFDLHISLTHKLPFKLQPTDLCFFILRGKKLTAVIFMLFRVTPKPIQQPCALVSFVLCNSSTKKNSLQWSKGFRVGNRSLSHKVPYINTRRSPIKLNIWQKEP